MWPSMYFIFTVQIHGLKPISFPDLELMYRIQDLKYIGPCPAQYGRTRALFKAPLLWSGARAHWSTAHTTTAKPPLPFPSSWGWRMGGCLDGRGEEKYRAIYSLWLLLAWFFFFFCYSSQQAICFLSATWHQCPIGFFCCWSMCVKYGGL